ncbi:hypothetical protein D3C84_571000 [compost metagenome]
MLCKLDGNCADTTGTRVDKDFLSLFQPGCFNQHLPGGQRNQGERSSFFHGDIFGFQREGTLLHRNQLGEGANARFGWACIDLVTRLEAVYSRPHANHNASQVITHNQRE